jgi:AcrR family transcriptional regulator
MSQVLSRRGSDTHAAQRLNSRNAILAATVELLGSGRAYADLSVVQIASAAGVSRPTFYSHFDDKRALVLALAHVFESDARRAARAWLDDRTDDLSSTLAGVLEAFTRHRETVGAIVEAATYDDDVAAFWRAFHEWFIENAVRRAQGADPHLPEEEATALAYSLVWMTERSFTEHLSAPRVPTPELLRAIEHLWRAVVPAADDQGT